MRNMFYGAIKPIFERAEQLRKNPTFEEDLLWQYLKGSQLGVRFKRQHPIWLYIADFYCHEVKLVIEIDGSIHNVVEVKEQDVIREENICSFGISVIRFKNSEVRNSILSVLERIRAAVNELKKNGKQNE